ncbi:MAG: DNA methyltransferase [Candidatus Obscuribacterales bacterium]
MKSSHTFRTFKRSVEASLKALAPAGSISSVFPSTEFITCIILVALKVLEARNQLDRLNCVESQLSKVGSLRPMIDQLCQTVNMTAPNEIRLSTTENDFPSESQIAEALRHLEQTPSETWQNDLTIGYAYQFLSMQARKNAQANIQTANKEFSKTDMIAFTQLYTPDWVVDFLLANCALPQLEPAFANQAPNAYRIWQVNAPINAHSITKSRKETAHRTASDLTILDPACGAGNFLVRALDLSINLHLKAGLSAEKSVQLAQKRNVYGADIDIAALWITCLSLLIKCFQYSKNAPSDFFNVAIAKSQQSPDGDHRNDLLGSLARDFEAPHVLSQKYAVVLMNPPYIGRKLMSRQLKSALKSEYPDSHSDISAAFIERSLELLEDCGSLGTITQASVLTLPSYGKLRKTILTKYHIFSCADAGSGVFPLQGGDKVNSALLVIENKAQPSTTSNFFDLRLHKDKPQELLGQLKLLNDQKNGSYFRHDQRMFLEEHENAIKYACPGVILALSRQVPTLSEIAEIRQGLATSDNERFIKKIDDVPAELIGSTWVPYVKGAGADRWFSPVVHVVNWENDGREIKEAVSAAYPYLNGNIKWVVKNEQFYFRSGLCFSFVNTGNLAVRKLPAGCIFDVGASAVFVNEGVDEDFLLAYLNSSLIAAIAKSINPTINFQVGDLKRLPLFPLDLEQRQKLSDISKECQRLATRLHDKLQADPVTAGRTHQAQPYVAPDRGEAQLTDLEKQNDEIVLSAFVKAFALTSDQQAEVESWVRRVTGKTK